MLVAGRVEGDKDAFYKEKVVPALERLFPYLESVVKKSGSGFIAPSGVTWADFFIAESLTTLIGFTPDVAKKYPFAPEYVKRVYDHPKIKSYISSRKQIPL